MTTRYIFTQNINRREDLGKQFTGDLKLLWNDFFFFVSTPSSSSMNGVVCSAIVSELIKLRKSFPPVSTGLWSLFLIKLQAREPTVLLKRDSNIVIFLWNLQKIFKNIYFEEYLWTTASKNQYVTEKTIHRFLSQNYEFHNYYYNLWDPEVSSVLLCSFC